MEKLLLTSQAVTNLPGIAALVTLLLPGFLPLPLVTSAIPVRYLDIIAVIVPRDIVAGAAQGAVLHVAAVMAVPMSRARPTFPLRMIGPWPRRIHSQIHLRS